MRTSPDDPETLSEETGPTRTCILSRTQGERQHLIRLVPGPDGAVWPDLAARLPGRGAWVQPDGALIAAAVGDGRLRRALARSWRDQPPAVPADLAGRIAAGLEARALQRLGLEHRAGHLLFGSERIGEWARGQRLALLLHAADAAPDGVAKLDQALRVGNMERTSPPARALPLPAGRLALSAALGRDNIVHIGVSDGGAAARVLADVARWRAYMGKGCTGPPRSDRSEVSVPGPVAEWGFGPDVAGSEAPAPDNSGSGGLPDDNGGRMDARRHDDREGRE